MNKTLVILFSINIVTSQPVLEELYYENFDYDGYININDILYISNSIDDELSYNFMFAYYNDNAINKKGIHSIISTIFGLGIWKV